MNEEIIKVIDALCSKFGIAIDWTSTNILPQIVYIVERYSVYLKINAIFYTIFCLLMFIVGLLVFIKCQHDNHIGKDWTHDGTYWSGLFVLLVVLSFCAFCFGLVGIFVNIEALIKVYTIPEIYSVQQLIKYISLNIQ